MFDIDETVTLFRIKIYTVSKMDNVNKVRVKCFRYKLFNLLILTSVICFAYTVYKFRNYYSLSTASRHNRTQLGNRSVNDGLLSVSNLKRQLDISDPIDVIITLTKAEFDTRLQNKFRICVRSLLHFSSIHVNLYIIGDNSSRNVADQILTESGEKSKYTVSHIYLYSSGFILT